jgi:hypothetical protein
MARDGCALLRLQGEGREVEGHVQDVLVTMQTTSCRNRRANCSSAWANPVGTQVRRFGFAITGGSRSTRLDFRWDCAGTTRYFSKYHRLASAPVIACFEEAQHRPAYRRLLPATKAANPAAVGWAFIYIPFVPLENGAGQPTARVCCQ